MADKWRVGAQLDFGEQDYPRGPAFLTEGFALPSAFTVVAESEADLHVEVNVQIEKGRARSRRIVVSTTHSGGVTSTTMRQVPIRDIVARGCQLMLLRAQVQPDGKIELVSPPWAPLTEEAAEAAWPEIRRVIEELVGYVEVTRENEGPQEVQRPLVRLDG